MPGIPNQFITRWPNGISDATLISQFGAFAGLRPNRYHILFSDFFDYVSGQWVVTETDSGSTEAITNGDGGVLAITNASAGAADEASIQWAANSGAIKTPFTWASNKDMFVGGRFKISSVANAALILGLAVEDTTPVASLPTDGVWFSKPAGADLDFTVRKSSSSSTVAVTDAMADDTFVTAVLAYTAEDGYWRAFLDDVQKGTLTTASISPTSALAPTIGLLNASTDAHVLSVDWMFFAKQA